MSDLIDRQGAIDAIDQERKRTHLFNTAEDGLLHARGIIKTLPSKQLAEQKKGKWIYNPELYPHGNGRYDCDRCGESVQDRINFCPYCGADMRGEKK